MDPQQSPSTLKPDRFAEPGQEPMYEGHDLNLGGMSIIWSIGRTPQEAVEAFCLARCGSPMGAGSFRVMEGGDPAYTWGCRFTMDEGTGMKAAGIHVPGGVVLTWWK